MAQGEPLYRIALFDGPGDNDPKPVEVSWDDLVSELSSFKVTDCREPDPERPRDGDCRGHHCEFKKTEAWSPTDYADDCERRADANVRAITLAVYDLDNPTPEAMADLAEALSGVRYACHGTHTLGSYRLTLAISAPVLPADWPRVWNLIRTHYKIPADSACANLSRVYFLPSKPYGRGEGEFYAGEGAPIDLAWLADLYASVPTPTPRAQAAQVPATPVPVPLPEPPLQIDLVKIRKELQRVSRPESAELIRKIFGTEPLARMHERDITVNKAASLLARASSVTLSADLIVELLKPSISLMPLEPEGLQYWLDKAHYSATRALKRRVATDAREARLTSALTRGLKKTAKVDKPEAEPGEGPEDDPWQDHLLTVEDEDGNEKLRQCGANANLILRHDENWENFLVFNEMTKEVDVLGGPLANAPKATLHVEVANWLARSHYELILKPQEVGPQILAVARQNPVNPLRDYLQHCKQVWLDSPRKPKLENFLMEFYGARGDPYYLKEVGRRWLISAVARALRPGCFVKNVVVLEGAQDAGKSSSLRILGGQWFSDTSVDIHSRDGRMAASRFWIIELAELASIKRSNNETVKTFLSSCQDDIRLPYGHVLESFPRCCIFVATTNESEYLTDPTGNTRYWPVLCGAIDLVGLEQWRDLIWGEAVAALEEGEPWWFEREETDMLQLAEKEQRERTRQSPYLDRILNWFLSMEPARRPQLLDADDVAVRALGLTGDRITEKVRQDIGFAMAAMQFKRVRRRVDSILVYRYELPEFMRTLPQESKPLAAHLQVIQKMTR